MSGEKTEEPTDQRLRESAEKGQVPQRKNVSEAFTLMTAASMIFAMWPIFVRGISDIFDVALDAIDRPLAEKWQELASAIQGAFTFSLVITGTLALSGLFLHLLMNKFNFAPKSLAPKFEKFNPVSGLKGIFSKTTIYNFVRLNVFFGSAATILFFVVKLNLGEIVRASHCGPECVAAVFYRVFLLTIVLIFGVLLILAALDFRIQNAIFMSQSKMTKDEVKREYKGREGDPLIKSKRKQIAMEDAAAPTLRDVTHVVYSGGYMVALVFTSGRLPFVAMRIKGDGVRRMTSRYRGAGVKCVNLPDVARDFYNKSVAGQYMSRDCIPGMKKIIRSGA